MATIEKTTKQKRSHIYFRIPFTWYYLAKVAPMVGDNEPVAKRYWCLATKCWDAKEKFYYYKFLV